MVAIILVVLPLDRPAIYVFVIVAIIQPNPKEYKCATLAHASWVGGGASRAS